MPECIQCHVELADVYSWKRYVKFETVIVGGKVLTLPIIGKWYTDRYLECPICHSTFNRKGEPLCLRGEMR